MDELKQVELKLLEVFCDICKKYNLQYYLLGGSLLGAIRHRGFIPWDDDIDVGMPRKDYELFGRIAQQELPKGIFYQSFQSDPNYVLCFSKLRDSNTTFIESSIKSLDINHGIYIDVFPLDYYPEKNVIRFKLLNELYRARISVSFDTVPSNKMRIMQLISKIFVRSSYEATVKRDNLMKEVSNSQTLANICGAWGEKEIMPKEWFGAGIEVDFEGLTVLAPKEYDLYLSKMYGDYMTLPPIEERIGHHYAEVIDVNNPYISYTNQH